MEPPTDDQLRKFHASRPDLFTLPPAYAFRQVLYLPAEARGDTLKTELELLRAGESVPKDRLNKLSLPLDWPLTPAPELANAFGGNFAKALATLPEGEWAGPVRSGLGFHLVKVSEAKSGGLAPFDEIRDFVERQYEYYSVLDAQQKMFTELRDKYDIKFTARGVPEAVIKSYSRP